MFYVIILFIGFVLSPITSLLCRLLHLDDYDTQLMILTSMPFSAFCLILGLWGAVIHG